MASYDRTYGGAGGKFQKRTSRKYQTTPYDRPITAIRPTQTINNNNNSGWLSKIVDPASKLITAGAHKFFSSVFRKRLLPPPPQNSPVMGVGEGKETEDMQLETATNVVTSDNQVPVDCGGNDGSMPSDSNGVAELEDMLKQKTFTRSQIDHLTALLLSRTNESSDGIEKGQSEPKLSDLKAVHVRHDKLFILPAHENGFEHAQVAAYTPELRSKVLSDDVASPAEIAKAYMGSRPTNVSPSVLRLQNLLPNEDLSTPSNQLSQSISPVMSLKHKPVSDIGTSNNGFMTPRFRGRSAIYSMARTPYSRVHPVTTNKAPETNFSTGGRSPYLNATGNNSSNKQLLKRRSSVLENDIGSVGPIRRIRQKPNLLHPKTFSLPPSGGRQVMQVPGERSKVLAENNLPDTSSGYVPSQSIEMAQKIFDKLDKLSPNGNLGKNVGISVGLSPTETPSIERLDSLKPLQSSQDIKKSVGSLDAENNNQAKTSSMVEEISAKKFGTVSGSLDPGDGAEGKKAALHLSSESKAAVFEMPVSVVNRPQKRAFQMSAHEDFLELDDDLPSNEVSLSTPLAEGKQLAESHRGSVTIPDMTSQDQAITMANPPVTKTTTDLGKSELESLANGSSASKTTNSFPPFMIQSSIPGTNMTVPEVINAPQSVLESDKVAPKSEISNVITASSSMFRNLPPFVSTPPPAAKDTKLETPVSSSEVAAEVIGPDKPDNKSTSIFGTKVINSGDPLSVGTLSNGSQPNNAIPANGVPITVPEKADASIQVPITTSSNNPNSFPVSLSSPSPSIFNFLNGSVQPTFTPSASTPEPSLTSLPSASVATPVFTFTSVFPSPSTSSATCTSDAKPSTFATGCSVPTEGATVSNKLPFSFQSSSTAPGSKLAPSFPSLSASSVSPPASVSALNFLGQSASSVSAPTLVSTSSFPSVIASSALASTSTPTFPSQSTTSPSQSTIPTTVSTSNFPSSGSIIGSFSANPCSSGSGSGTVSSGFGSSCTSSSISTSVSASLFPFTSQSPKLTPAFGIGSSGANTSIPEFGATATNPSSGSISQPLAFGNATSQPFVSSPFQSQTAFSNSINQSQPFAAIRSSPSTNNDQLTMEDTMAEDSSQPSPPLAFGAPPPFAGASPAFGGAPPAFGGTPTGGFAPTPAIPLSFNPQQSQNTPQNPFQLSGSLEFSNGSFSLGATDKSQRRFVSKRKTVRRK